MTNLKPCDVYQTLFAWNTNSEFSEQNLDSTSMITTVARLLVVLATITIGLILTCLISTVSRPHVVLSTITIVVLFHLVYIFVS